MQDMQCLWNDNKLLSLLQTLKVTLLVILHLVCGSKFAYSYLCIFSM